MLTDFWGKENRLRVTLYLFVIGISLPGITRRVDAVKEVSLFERLMMDMVGPAQNAIFKVKRGVASFINNYFYLVEIKKKSDLLHKEIFGLKNQIFKLEELQKENKRLKYLLKFGEELKYKKILARVIGWDASENVRLIRVNRGSENGVKLEFPVVASEGLVGYVYRVSSNFSDIMTVLDQNNRVDGIVTRTRSHGIVEGYTNGKCIMKYITRNEPIVLNDQIVTSGLGSLYPKGLKIGKISKIERESYGITQFVELDSSVDFGKLEEVIILKP